MQCASAGILPDVESKEGVYCCFGLQTVADCLRSALPAREVGNLRPVRGPYRPVLRNSIRSQNPLIRTVGMCRHDLVSLQKDHFALRRHVRQGCRVRRYDKNCCPALYPSPHTPSSYLSPPSAIVAGPRFPYHSSLPIDRQSPYYAPFGWSLSRWRYEEKAAQGR